MANSENLEGPSVDNPHGDGNESNNPALNRENLEVDTGTHEEEAPETSERTPSSPESTPAGGSWGHLNIQNQGIFARMSERGKAIANQAYDKIRELPGKAKEKVEQAVGRLEISYNQHWSDVYQKKVGNLNNQVYQVDAQIGSLDQTKAQLQDAMKQAEAQGVPTDSFEIDMKKVDQQRRDLETKKDRYQSGIEASGNSVSIYTNKRDRVAHGFIEQCDESLKPIDKELEGLQMRENQMGLTIAVMEKKHNDAAGRLNGVDDLKTQLEEALRSVPGNNERSIKNNPVVRRYEEQIREGRKRMQADREEMGRRKMELDKDRGRVNEKRNRYADTRNEFARARDNRPVERNAAREREMGYAQDYGEEKIQDAQRPWASAPQNPGPVPEGGTHEAGHTEERGGGAPEIVDERPTTEMYLSKWNDFVAEEHNLRYDELRVEQQQFLNQLGGALRSDEHADPKDFKKIFEQYAKIALQGEEGTDELIDEFFSQEKYKEEDEEQSEEESSASE